MSCGVKVIEGLTKKKSSVFHLKIKVLDTAIGMQNLSSSRIDR